MNDDELRALVRESVARHLAGGSFPAPDARPLTLHGHPSHDRYPLPPSGGPCLIEPGVACNHCGYCESHGH